MSMSHRRWKEASRPSLAQEGRGVGQGLGGRMSLLLSRPRRALGRPPQRAPHGPPAGPGARWSWTAVASRPALRWGLGPRLPARATAGGRSVGLAHLPGAPARAPARRCRPRAAPAAARHGRARGIAGGSGPVRAKAAAGGAPARAPARPAPRVPPPSRGGRLPAGTGCGTCLLTRARGGARRSNG